MNRLVLILVLYFPLQINLLYSQNTASELMREVSILAARNAVGGLSYDNIEGSPHYTKEFVNGIVYLRNGQSVPLPVRYNLYQDQIEFKRGKEILWIVKIDVKSIQYGKELIIPEILPEEPGKTAYFFGQEEGKYKLYVRKKVSFQPEEPAQGYADPAPNRFERDNDVYYLKQEGMPAKEIRNKKALAEILADNEPALSFIKKSKIRATKEKDLLELVAFLNNQ